MFIAIATPGTMLWGLRGVPLRPSALATVALLAARPRLCADGPEETPDANPSPAFVDADEVLLGAPRSSYDPAELPDVPSNLAPEDVDLIGDGSPSLREEWYLKRARGELAIDGPSLEEMRARREMAAKRAEELRCELLISAGALDAQAVRRCMRKAPYLNRVDPEALRERLQALHELLPSDRARKSFLDSAGCQMLTHYNFTTDLPRRLSALEEVVGLPAESVVIRAPSLLFLAEKRLQGRLHDLRDAFPELDVVEVLRRAPRLLSFKPSRLRETWDVLLEGLPPDACVTSVFAGQPTLLGSSANKIRAKLVALKELLTHEEWRSLVVRPASLARVLTASESLIVERLRAEPLVDVEGRPRRVIPLLVMPHAKYAARQRASRDQ